MKKHLSSLVMIFTRSSAPSRTLSQTRLVSLFTTSNIYFSITTRRYCVARRTREIKQHYDLLKQTDSFHPSTERPPTTHPPPHCRSKTQLRTTTHELYLNSLLPNYLQNLPSCTKNYSRPLFHTGKFFSIKVDSPVAASVSPTPSTSTVVSPNTSSAK